MFSCCCHETNEEIEEIDKIELAFQRMDINKDGFVTYSEFKKVSAIFHLNNVNNIYLQHVDDKEEECIRRIFLSCDEDGDRRLTLMEIRNMLAEVDN